MQRFVSYKNYFSWALISAFLSIALAHETEISRLQLTTQRFMDWYLPGQGRWMGHISNPPDWCRANGLEALSNYLYYSMDNIKDSFLSPQQEDQYYEILVEVLNAQGSKFYQDAEYFDDILWWSLAYTRAYEYSMIRKRNYSESSEFIRIAKDINDVVYRDSWTSSVCGGGCYWSRAFSYKNAITNELFAASSARLARLTGNDTFYSRAKVAIDWISRSGMIQDNNLIVDGLSNSTCQPAGNIYTYNQGVILGALAELNIIRSNDSLLSTGIKIIESVLANLTDSDGVLQETSCGDGALFKGIFMRYLRYFINAGCVADPNTRNKFENFIFIQTDSIWSKARSNDSFFAKSWSGPAGERDHNLQIAAMDAFAALPTPSRPQKVESLTSKSCNSHGAFVMGECICDVRFYGKDCSDEIPWVDYYSNQNIYLIGSNNRLICSGTNSAVFLFTAPHAVWTCCQDDLMPASIITVKAVLSATSQALITSKIGSDGVGAYLMLSSGFYISSTADGSALTTTAAPDSCTVFAPVISPKNSSDYVITSEFVAFQSVCSGAFISVASASIQDNIYELKSSSESFQLVTSPVMNTLARFRVSEVQSC